VFGKIPGVKEYSRYEAENQLLAGWRAGDREAYRTLVDRYHQKIIRTCKGFVHSDADAEDIAQDVFVEVFRSVGQFRGDSEISTWIYRIAVNRSINFLRSKSRMRVLSFLAGDSRTGEDRVPEKAARRESCPDEELHRTDRTNALNKAVDSLPANQRTAFILSKYEEMSYREISEVMKVSIGSVESLIFRAKQNLQKKLQVFYRKNMR
jgi:RNA polymerase sigma-70 factor (ECF subfamily)